MNEGQLAHYHKQQKNLFQQRVANINQHDRIIYQQNPRGSYRERVENMNAVEIDNLRRHQMQPHRVRRHKPVLNRAFVNEFEHFNVEEMNIICEYCGALRFKNENNSCCYNGKVNVPTLQPYQETLKRLFE
ncbi:Hypothetical predicted protein [Octopus vulgaris]|uniref:Uncharacterized protein n=1 Tax=Octopus vulgaris TaxID=6645 RepID=A0AA36F164_OCTVU|nr:Hypothetical predicted protein [Octopus vulgaris]